VRFRSRLVPGLLISGLVIAGAGSVIAASGGSSSTNSSSKAQYCPPNSPGAGQPQGGPNNNCGHPKKKKKKPKWHTRRSPRKGCVRRTFVLKIGVANKPSRNRVFVRFDGRRLKSSRKSGFKVRINARRLHRGLHTLTFRVRGSDGKLYKKTIRFKRC
jgi:hypothetical protein